VQPEKQVRNEAGCWKNIPAGEIFCRAGFSGKEQVYMITLADSDAPPVNSLTN